MKTKKILSMIIALSMVISLFVFTPSTVSAVITGPTAPLIATKTVNIDDNNTTGGAAYINSGGNGMLLDVRNTTNVNPTGNPNVTANTRYRMAFINFDFSAYKEALLKGEYSSIKLNLTPNSDGWSTSTRIIAYPLISALTDGIGITTSDGTISKYGVAREAGYTVYPNAFTGTGGAAGINYTAAPEPYNVNIFPNTATTQYSPFSSNNIVSTIIQYFKDNPTKTTIGFAVRVNTSTCSIVGLGTTTVNSKAVTDAQKPQLVFTTETRDGTGISIDNIAAGSPADSVSITVSGSGLQSTDKLSVEFTSPSGSGTPVAAAPVSIPTGGGVVNVPVPSVPDNNGTYDVTVYVTTQNGYRMISNTVNGLTLNSSDVVQLPLYANGAELAIAMPTNANYNTLSGDNMLDGRADRYNRMYLRIPVPEEYRTALLAAGDVTLDFNAIREGSSFNGSYTLDFVQEPASWDVNGLKWSVSSTLAVSSTISDGFTYSASYGSNGIYGNVGTANIASNIRKYFADYPSADAVYLRLVPLNTSTIFRVYRTMNATKDFDRTAHLTFTTTDARNESAVTLSASSAANQLTISKESGTVMPGDRLALMLDSGTAATKIMDLNAANLVSGNLVVTVPYTAGNNDQYTVTANLKNKIGNTKGTSTQSGIPLYTAQVKFNKNTTETVAGMPANLTNLPLGSPITKPSTDPTTANYTFTNWSTDAAGANPWNFSANLGTATLDANGVLNLYANWKAATPQYNVVIHDAAGDPFETKTYYEGDTLYTYGRYNLTKDGNRFIGWSTTPTGNTVNYTTSDSLTVTGNVDLYPVWAPLASGRTIELFKSDSTSLNNPGAVVMDKAGNLYVANLNGRIYKVDSATSAATLIAGISGDNPSVPLGNLMMPTGSYSATGIAFDSSQNLYIASYDAKKVYQITNMNPDKNGVPAFDSNSTVNTIASLGFNPYGIALDNDDNLLMGTNAASAFVYKKTGGTTIPTYDGTNINLNIPGQARNIVADNIGNIYVANRNTGGIYKIEKTGDFTYKAATVMVALDTGGTGTTTGSFTDPATKICQPWQLAYDKVNNIIYAGMEAGRGVAILDLNNNHLDMFIGGNLTAGSNLPTETTVSEFTHGVSNGFSIGAAASGVAVNDYGDVVFSRTGNAYIITNHTIVTFGTNGVTPIFGTMPEQLSVRPGKAITIPDGSTIATATQSVNSWNTQADGNGTNLPAKSSFVPARYDITLYATWGERVFALGTAYDADTAAPLDIANIGTANKLMLKGVLDTNNAGSPYYIDSNGLKGQEKAIIASYNAAGDLVALILANISCNGNDIVLNLAAPLGSNVVENGSVKIMLWNSMDTISPLSMYYAIK